MKICAVVLDGERCPNIAMPNEPFCGRCSELIEDRILKHKRKPTIIDPNRKEGPGKGSPGVPRTSEAHRRQFQNLSNNDKTPNYTEFQARHHELTSLKEQARVATQEVIEKIKAKRERKANENR